MTAMPKPTDSVLRRHFESSAQSEDLHSYPQDSTLIRHHEQMRAAGHSGPMQLRTEELPQSPVPSVVPHPLAAHLEMRSPSPYSAEGISTPITRKTKPRAPVRPPPEESTLTRHYAQMNDPSFAEHPLATHLRLRAQATQTTGEISSSEAELSVAGGTTNTRKADRNEASTLAPKSGHTKLEAQESEPEETGFFRRLLRSITGRK